ncbi:acyl-CoA thioesterase [Gandjariella thermophila]|uniref:Acyl-CoA thioesterase 2 n=1 Tax=Gandjariella thermophila TaxID=1931992 RepID=A0A4D4J2R2_9PSEU|nr:acyl-CoA thioesterase II [Gandjariella thermophila]GDY29078.1 acyl-CoA thioesterase II [Gandjariella thermophila]
MTLGTAVDPLDALVSLLDLEPTGPDGYRGHSPQYPMRRVFGGQVAAQALVAAGRTVDAERPVHSLHAYFLAPGDPSVPIDYTVQRLRDGRSFSARQVLASQRGETIFTMSASFQRPGEGPEHRPEMPDAPDPESLARLSDRVSPYPDRTPAWWRQPNAIDLRFTDKPPLLGDTGPREPRQRVWLRANGTLPDDPALHSCVLAYASDMSLLGSILLPHGAEYQPGEIAMASLDHAMWFHRPVRADRWLLYAQESPTSSGARGFTRAGIFTRDGDLAVSVAQEGMVRVRRSARPANPPRDGR